MKKLCLPLAVALLVALAAHAARAQLLDDRANMKVLRTRTQMLRMNKDQFKDLTPAENLRGYRAQVGCGHVDIANQSVQTSTTGDIEVIITGDVINTGNVCRDY